MSRLEEIRSIAEAVHELRPDWDLGGIQKALWNLRDRGDLEQLRAAAMRAVRNPQSRTPAAVGFEQHWRTDGDEDGPVPFQPLPECVGCGQPARREAAAKLRFCPHCGLPWVALELDPYEPEPLTSKDVAAFAERARRWAIDIRRALGHRQLADPAVEADVRAVACPWCHASPGRSCVDAYSGEPLRLTSAHPARHTAAGVAPLPRVSVDELAARRGGRTRPDPGSNGHAQRAVSDR